MRLSLISAMNSFICTFFVLINIGAICLLVLFNVHIQYVFSLSISYQSSILFLMFKLLLLGCFGNCKHRSSINTSNPSWTCTQLLSLLLWDNELSWKVTFSLFFCCSIVAKIRKQKLKWFNSLLPFGAASIGFGVN